MVIQKKQIESRTAQLRKSQVLEAAANCFRLEGFHRSSMSQIATASNMSSGHIYHYFGSKEGIVAALVARECSKLDLMIEDLKKASQDIDVVSAMVDQTEDNVARYIDEEHASLAAEILAEAARNPEIASVIQENDRKARREFYDLLGGDTPETQSRCEILAALFEGLSARALRNPALKATIDPDMLRNLTRHLLTN